MDNILTQFPQRFIEDSKYAYPLGRVRSLEVHILEYQDYEKMAEGDLSETQKILVESDFSLDVNLLLKEETFEKVLEVHKENVFKLMDELIPDEEIKRILRLEYDFYNAKILLLEKILDRKIGEPSHLGNISIERLKYIFSIEKYNLLPSELFQTIQEGIKLYYERREKRVVDFVFDRNYLEYVSKNAYPPFLMDYYKILADIKNLLVLLRIKYFGDDPSILNEVFSRNGFIPITLLNSLKNLGLEEIPNELKRWIYFKQLEEGIKFLKEKNSFVRIENLFNSLLYEYLRTTKYLSLGPEPVIAFILMKLNEIRNVRLILVGKFYGVKSEEIMGRIVL